MRTPVIITVAAYAIALSGCDAVRFPGDGRPLPDNVDANLGAQSGVADPDKTQATPDEENTSSVIVAPEDPVTEPDSDDSPEDLTDTQAEESPPDMPDPENDSDARSSPTGPEQDAALEDTNNATAPDQQDPPSTDTSSDPPRDTVSETEDGSSNRPEEQAEAEPDPSEDPSPLPIKFQYYPPGSLVPSSGAGLSDTAVYAPNMVFPIKDDPAFPGSQVWGYGGGMSTGGQCDARNYTDAVWRDNFCEYRSRARETPLCPTNNAHQGQDIRVGSRQGCLEMVAGRPEKPTLYEVVATEDGIIQYIGSYSLTLKGTETGNLYNYLHLNMGALQVAESDTVTAGQVLGYISDDFGGTPTTYHLHFEIKGALENIGFAHLPPYTSLIAAYERRENGRGEQVEAETVAVAALPTLPEGVIIEE